MKQRGHRHRRPAVLVGLGETAGYCSQLVEGFQAIGVRSLHLNLGRDPLAYTQPYGPGLARLARVLKRRRASRPASWMWRTAHRLVMVALFVQVAVRYDAFILRAGDSFFGLRDLPLLRRLGKTVVVVFFGSDSRPTYMNGAEMARGIDGRTAAAATAAKRAMVRRVEATASDIVCHILTSQLHQRPCVQFLRIGIPRRLPTMPPVPPPPLQDRPIRILHAPSNPAGKGTDAVREAVSLVRGRGIDVELTVISGRPNHEVLAAIDACDFVVDALHSDTPMAGFAAEAAARGRPAVVGGYGWKELARFTPDEILPPSLLTVPEQLDAAIARMAEDHAYRLDLGTRARRFIEEHWAPAAVAERMLVVVAGDPPADWTFDPTEPVHPFGVGLTAGALRGSVASVVSAVGAEGLQIADKPALLDRLLKIADGADSG